MKPDRVCRVRHSVGLTQPDLGKLLGRHPLTVSRWERGTLAVRGWDLEMLLVLELVSTTHPEISELLSERLRGSGAPSALYLVLSKAFAP